MITKNNIKNNELYKNFFENSCLVMLIIHPETGDIIDANTSACNFYNYNKHEITNMSIYDINILPREKIYKEMQKSILSNCNYFNFHHILASGKIRNVEVISRPIKIGNEINLHSIIYDITDRILIEKKLKMEKIFSESLIKSLPGIMYLFDKNGKVSRWNRNLEFVTGYSEKEILNMTPLDVIHSEDKEKVSKQINEVFKKGQATIEAEIITKDGKIIPYYFTGARLEVNGAKYLVGIGLDITERKQIEIEKENLIEKLHEALSKIKQLSGLLPICSSCKKIRDDNGYWNQIEEYIYDHSEAKFTHSICPECAKKLYPDHIK